MKAIRTITISMLIIANLASAWLVPLIYVDFELREDYIAKVLCVEREQAITTCKGSCYLTRQLDKAADQQEKENKVNVQEIVYFFQQSFAGNIPQANLLLIKEIDYPAFQHSSLSDPQLSGVFHPPRL